MISRFRLQIHGILKATPIRNTVVQPVDSTGRVVGSGVLGHVAVSGHVAVPSGDQTWPGNKHLSDHLL